MALKPAGGGWQVPGVCNSYVPSNSVIDRFLYVVNYITSQGMYVVMDNQLNLDRTALNNPNSWAQQVGPAEHQGGQRMRKHPQMRTLRVSALHPQRPSTLL